MDVYRHGDVLIATCDAVPPSARPQQGLVLARGEVTGHSHRVVSRGLAQLYALGEDLYLQLAGTSAQVVHEEHRTIELPLGTYRVWRQREFDPIADERWIED